MITALFSPFISVAHAVTMTISTSVPGMSANANSSPGAYVAGIYQFALMIGGVLAFGIIVYGGVKYMASAGNPSGQGDAKEWIEAALLGLLLLVGAYFILNVVNPQLTNLALPALTPVNIQSTATTATTPSCGSYGSTGNEVAGNCANSANGNINYCCSLDHGITWACQTTSCSTNPTYTCLGNTNGTCQPGYTCTNEGFAGGLLGNDFMCVPN